MWTWIKLNAVFMLDCVGKFIQNQHLKTKKKTQDYQMQEML